MGVKENVEPQPIQEVTVKAPIFPFCAKRFVELAVAEKKLVVVAEVPVALAKIRFWRLVEPVTRRVESIVELAVDKNPFKKPIVVEVETP